MSGRAAIALALVATALFTASSAAADPVNTAPPQLSGASGGGMTPFVVAGTPSTLTATPGDWLSTAPLQYAYQWQRCSYGNAVVDQAPLAYYRLDEPSGTTAYDSSGLGFDGTYTKVYASWTQDGKLGLPGALSTSTNLSAYFHGKPYGTQSARGSKVSATIEGGLPSGSAPVSVEGWIYATTGYYNNFEPLVSFGDLTTGTWAFGLQPSSSSSATLVLKGPGEIATSTSTIAPGQWHFIAATDDGSTQQLYIDGAPAGSFSATTTKPTSSLLNIAYQPTPDPNGNTSGGYYFNGDIDEVAVYDHILGASDVAQQYAAATDPSSGSGCEDIPGAIVSSYSVNPDDAGSSIRAQVTAYGEDGEGWAMTPAAELQGDGGPVWTPPPAPQTSGPVIDSGTLTDSGGAPIAGATVALYPNSETHSVVRPPALAVTTTDANGNYSFILNNTGLVSRLENAGSVNLTRQVTLRTGVLRDDFSRTFYGGHWLDDNGLSLLLSRISWDPTHVPRIMIGWTPPNPGPGGCRPITTAIGEADAWAPVGELHLFADDYGWFSYGQSHSADSTFGVGVSTDNVNFSIGGSTHITNTATVGWGSSDDLLGPYFSHVLITKFHFEKTRTQTCFMREYKVSATQWEAGKDEGQDTSGNDGRCNVFPDNFRTTFGPHGTYDRSTGRAYTYDGAVSVLGASLSVTSGYSSSVAVHFRFGTALDQHWLCGDNGSIVDASRIFAGP